LCVFEESKNVKICTFLKTVKLANATGEKVYPPEANLTQYSTNQMENGKFYPASQKILPSLLI
jgi:hypothetical protein